MVLIDERGQDIRETIYEMFPSPYGDYGSYHRLELNFKAAGRNRLAFIFKKQVRHINNVLPSQFIL